MKLEQNKNKTCCKIIFVFCKKYQNCFTHFTSAALTLVLGGAGARDPVHPKEHDVGSKKSPACSLFHPEFQTTKRPSPNGLRENSPPGGSPHLVFRDTNPGHRKVLAPTPVPRKRLDRNFSNSASGGRLSRATVWSRKSWESSTYCFCAAGFVETRLRAAKLGTAKHYKSKTKSSIPRIPKGNPHEASGRPASPTHSVSTGIRLSITIDTLGSASAGISNS